jgi:hypothetical protein
MCIGLPPFRDWVTLVGIQPIQVHLGRTDTMSGSTGRSATKCSMPSGSEGVVTLSAISLISVIEQQAKSLKSHASAFAVIGKFHSI